MPVYAIISYDIEDNDAYQAYAPGVIPLLQKHGAEVVVADYDARRLEGDKHGVYVVLRFPSEDAARAWHGDPAYEEVRNIRLTSCTNNSIVITSEFEAASD